MLFSEVNGGDDLDRPDNGIVNSIPVTLNPGETNTGNDFVEEEFATISGAVTSDTDGDGKGISNLDTESNNDFDPQIDLAF